METLRRVVLNTTKTILPSEEYLNLEQPYQSLMVARKIRVKLLLFFLLLSLSNNVYTIMSSYYTYAIILGVKLGLQCCQFIFILVSISDTNRDTVFNNSCIAVFIEFLSLFTILIPYQIIDLENKVEVVVEILQGFIPYLIVLFSVKNVLEKLSNVNHNYEKVRNVILFISSPIYVFVSGIILNLSTFFDDKKYTYTIMSFIYVMLLIYIYTMFGNNTSLEVIWCVMALLIIYWFGFLSRFTTIIIQACIRIFKFKILIQDFLIYVVGDWEHQPLIDIQLAPVR